MLDLSVGALHGAFHASEALFQRAVTLEVEPALFGALDSALHVAKLAGRAHPDAALAT